MCKRTSVYCRICHTFLYHEPVEQCVDRMTPQFERIYPAGHYMGPREENRYIICSAECRERLQPERGFVDQITSKPPCTNQPVSESLYAKHTSSPAEHHSSKWLPLTAVSEKEEGEDGIHSQISTRGVQTDAADASTSTQPNLLSISESSSKTNNRKDLGIRSKHDLAGSPDVARSPTIQIPRRRPRRRSRRGVKD